MGVQNAKFNRRFYDATCGVKMTHHHVKLSNELKHYYTDVVQIFIQL